MWGYTYGDTATVTVHVRRIREKVEADPGDAAPPDHGLGRRLPVGPVSVLDAVELAAIAGGVTVLALALAAVVLRARRRRSMGAQIVALTCTHGLAVIAGAYAASRAMFISQHDLTALVVVLVAAGAGRDR